MKKTFLKIGHGICFLLTLFFTLAAFHFRSDIGMFLGEIFLGIGPALGMIAFRNELNEQRSRKILLCLGIWIVIVTLLFLSI